MSKQTRISLNSDGIRQLLQSAPLQADMERRTRAIAAAAGGEPDFEARVEVKGGSSRLGRVMGYVATATMEGRRAAATDNALIRALDAGRG
ncbi:hypothetical protein [Microcella alkaliphila]|uniref:Uncharacterized protein n=1 Tax=Microcella alkaliphila TaxID=279828 RepID=A0A0U4WXD9_9MICO|nr:hypothetical protein [Microcella alkaliphila]BAU32458.1 uncharacterized protein MalAC0309_1607 [Microcella alkaliphila]